jgi:hypothetical protein
MARTLGSAGRWRAVGAVAALLALVAPAAPAAAGQGPTVEVEPEEVRVGDVVTVTGDGWCCEGGAVAVQDELSGTVWGRVAIGEGGDLEGDLVVPDDAGVGDNLLVACGGAKVAQCDTTPLRILDPEVVDPTDPEVTDPVGPVDPVDPGPDPGDPATGDPADVLEPTAATGGDGARPWLVAGAVVLAVVAALVLWRLVRSGTDPADRRRRRRARVRAVYGPGSAGLAGPAGGPAVALTVHLDPRDPGGTTLVERRKRGRS